MRGLEEKHLYYCCKERNIGDEEEIMKVLDVEKVVNLFDVIKNRRSVRRMAAVQPTREQVECLLEAASYAPNHYMVEPWKFFVLTGQAREELGRVMAEALAARLEETTSDKAQAMLKKEREKPLQAPVIIVVAVERPRLSWEREIENVEAVSAAVQNMLLAAQAMGLASLWRTGDAAYDPHVKAWFGLSPDDHLVAFVYLGFAAVPNLERTPTHFASKTQWWGWER